MTAPETKKQPPPVRPVLAEIARKVLGVETLQVRGRDRLDFHDLHVRGIAEALEAAYEAGRKSARKGGAR